MTAPDQTARGGAGLIVHRGPDPNELVAALATELATPLPDPFDFDVVCVPSPGVERWLSQSLATRLGTAPGESDGVAAGIAYRPLERLLDEVVAALTGEDDLWSRQRLPWLVLAAMGQARGERWFADVERYAWPDGTAAGRAWLTAERFARLLDTYARQRPTMIDSWRVGNDHDAAGQALPGDHRWQPQLFRLVTASTGGSDPVLRRRAAIAQLEADSSLIDLPYRLPVFGPTRLDRGQLDVLAALARQRRVLLFTPVPSSVAAKADHEAVRHPLEWRLGRDARDLQTLLGPSATDTLDHPPTPPAAGLLGQLQADVEAARSPTPISLTPGDASISVHRSHGPDRQVEVLREVLLGLLADDPTLEPRDIVVMCPDIETFAPLIAASFGLSGDLSHHPGHALRVRLADRSLLQVNPVLAVLSEVLRLVDSRAGLSQILDLCAAAPVARAFAFTTDDLERLRVLSERAGVRWGLDAEHRTRYAMHQFGQNTWRAGLDRLLLGFAMDSTDQRFLDTALPLEDVESNDVARVGRLAELCARLEISCRELSREQPIDDWVVALRSTLERLVAVVGNDSWQLAHAHTVLADLLGTGTGQPLGIADLRALLAESFAGRPSRANFRTGSLTMCTLTPMRSVPHRVVCLLGMDDDRFPRRRDPDGDDILSLDPWVGDRDPRSEDRQLLLDAVLAARQHLVIIHSGASERTGERREACVPVQEVTDVLQQMIGTEGLTAITTDHALQPFSPTNFDPGHAQSFDTLALAAARAGATRAMPPADTWSMSGLNQPTIGTSVDQEAAEQVIELTELISFMVDPAKELLRVRTGLSLWAPPDPVPDEIPIELDGLQRWQIGERMLQAALDGADLDQVVAAEWRGGEVPPRALGGLLLEQLRADVERIVQAAGESTLLPARSTQVSVELGDRQLFGVVPGIRGNDIVTVSYSRLAPKHRLAAWIRLLSLAAAEPGTRWRAITIGKQGRTSVLGPIAASDARARLLDLLRIRDLGLTEVLPLPLRPAATVAEFAAGGTEPSSHVLRQNFTDESKIWHRWFPSVTDLHQPPARSIDRGNSAAAASERSRFRALARRIWQPLLEAEQ